MLGNLSMRASTLINLRQRFLTVYMLREMGDALESRRMRIDDEYSETGATGNRLRNLALKS